MSYDDLYNDSDLSPFGEDDSGVLPDVSNGAPDEQPMTPTAAGTGYYVPSAWESGLAGTLTSALNYAVARDQAKFAATHGYAPGVATMTANPMVAAQIQAKAANAKLLLIGGALVAAVLLMRK